MKRKKKELVFSSQIVVVFLAITFLLTTWSSLQAVGPQVSANRYHTVGLKANGTVVAVGSNQYGQLNVSSWTDIVQVAAGGHFTVGLKADGTVVAVGRNNYGQIDVGSWTNIVQVAADWLHTVGLKANGTVVAVGINNYGQIDVGSWTNIVQVDAGQHHTVGLEEDGTVVAVGDPSYGQLNVESWTDIVQVAAAYDYTVGLEADGTVVAVGWSGYGNLGVESWTDIVQVAADHAVTLGVKANGAVMAVGWNEYGETNVESWTDIVQVAAGLDHTVGLREDGTVVAVGSNQYGQCDTDSWDLTHHTLRIQKLGAGTGTITGTELSCSSDCTETFIYGTEIVLTANADTGSIFGGWSGCDSLADNVCTVTVNGTENITATFYLTHNLLVDLEGTGSGTVTSSPSGISCEPMCNNTFNVGTQVRLTANPSAGSFFAYWSGGCVGTKVICDLAMTGDKDVVAHFVSNASKEYMLSVGKFHKKQGDGTVISNDGNINCGDTCFYSYFKDTVLTLSATANDDSIFTGWSPKSLNCLGTDPCTLTMDKKKSVKAVFLGPNKLKVIPVFKKEGTGTVTSNDDFINCPRDCEKLYRIGEPVTLTATPADNASFIKWTGKPCKYEVTEQCTFNMDKNYTVKAIFEAKR